MTSSFDSESAPTSPNPTASSSDARDSASARDNILNLVFAGQKQSGNSSTPSLAMFIGGGTNRRIHKVNQEMTEQEREVTEKLEKEMEATRAKWGNKVEESPAPRSGGFSLASLMNKQVGATSSSSTQGDEPKRWQPSAASPPLASSDPVRSQTAPASSKVPSSQPTSSTTPRSLASAFGSTANGPRLNSASQAPADEQDGPVHARSGGGFAMPGLAKDKTEESQAQETKKEDSTPLVEPKVFSRPAPPPAEPAQAPAASSPTKVTFPSISPNDSPSKTASTTQNSTLGRLRGSSLVAERLKFAEQLQQQSSSPLSSPTKERGSTTTSPEKRRSVMDRWNRDQPNSFGNTTPASPTKSSTLPPPKSPGITGNSSPWSMSAKSNATSPKEEENQLVEDEGEEKNDSEPAYTSVSTVKLCRDTSSVLTSALMFHSNRLLLLDQLATRNLHGSMLLSVSSQSRNHHSPLTPTKKLFMNASQLEESLYPEWEFPLRHPLFLPHPLLLYLLLHPRNRRPTLSRRLHQEGFVQQR